MNPSDSKKLEEAKKMSVAIYLELPEPVADDVASRVRWLLSKVTEQDREIEELQLGKEAAERLNKMNVKVADGETDRAEKAEAYATEQEDIIKDLQAEVKQLEKKLQVIRDSRANATYKSIMAGKALAEKEKV